MRAILWKEMREQAHVAIILVVLGALVVAVIPQVPPQGDGGVTAAAIMGLFACIFGLVAGAQLFAGEREGETQAWLDTLPIDRRRLWFRKILAGAVVVSAQTILLWLIVFTIGRRAFEGGGRDKHFAIALMLMTFLSVCGYGGGLFGSTSARTTLGAIVWGILIQFLVIPAAFFFAVLLREGFVLGALLCVALSFAVLLSSARRYTLPDRLRHQSIRVLTAAGPATRRVVLWLSWRQGRETYLCLLLAGVALACVIPLTSPLAWPLIGTLFSVVAGLMAFGPDQNGSANRMFGDRRLPVGSIWIWKLALPLAVVAVTVALLALNLVARYWIADTDSANARDAIQRDFLWLRSGLSLATLVLGPLYGFACGQFFGLIYRKTVVAAVLALVTSLAAALLWLPSMALGGLHVWQWLFPPIVLLVASRAAMRPWVSGRIGALRPAAGLVFACVVAVALLAGGIVYRMVEWPAPATPIGSWAFIDNVSPENEGGQRLREALQGFGREVSKVGEKYEPVIGAAGEGPPPAAPPGLPPPGLPIVPGDQGLAAPGAVGVGALEEPPKDLITRAIEAVTGDWPEQDEKLNRFIDELARGEWVKSLQTAVNMPAGVLLDPRNSVAPNAHLARVVLLARSRQLQHRGDYEAALQPLELTFALAATLQSHANGDQLIAALIVEHEALGVLGRWADGVGARPELLRRALAAIRANDLGRAPLQTVVDVEFNSALHALLPMRHAVGGRSEFERSLIQFAGAVPWESERDRRLLEAVREGYLRYVALDFRAAAAAFARFRAPEPPSLGTAIFWRWVGKTGAVAAQDGTGQSLIEAIDDSPWLKDVPKFVVPDLSLWYNVQAQLQGSILRLALMLYECDHGKLPESLDALAPEYLPSLPTDPYSGGPFHYRISSGERVRMFHNIDESKAYRDLAPGAAVVWSVGPDLNDDGGRVREPNTQYAATVADSDVLFIVPRLKQP